MTDKRNLTMIAGDTVPITITWKSKATGVPINLSGYTFTYNVAEAFNRTPLLTKNLTNGIQVIDPANGKFSLTIASTDTNQNWIGSGAAKDFAHELKATDSNGVVTTLMQGTLTVKSSLA